MKLPALLHCLPGTICYCTPLVTSWLVLPDTNCTPLVACYPSDNPATGNKLVLSTSPPRQQRGLPSRVKTRASLAPGHGQESMTGHGFSRPTFGKIKLLTANQYVTMAYYRLAIKACKA